MLAVAPFLAARRMNGATHAVLPLVLAGVSAAFVHGLGFKPDGRLWRTVLSPWVAWPLIVLGWAALAASGAASRP